MGGRVYNDPKFKDLMNVLYYPLDNMRKSVEILKSASDQIDIQTMEFGQYQSILSSKQQWPNGGGAAWIKEIGNSRVSLTSQPNTTPLSNDQPDVVPLTKCALLDASIRKCFNSEPPICMKIDVTEQSETAANASQHDIKLVWEYGNAGSKTPTMLNLTMVCPYKS